MQEGRKQKIEQSIVQIVATLIERESNKRSLITVTHADLEQRGKAATIFVTVLPESDEEAALNFLKRKRPELRDALKRDLAIHPLPFLDVQIDKGEKARHTIDALLKEDSI